MSEYPDLDIDSACVHHVIEGSCPICEAYLGSNIVKYVHESKLKLAEDKLKVAVNTLRLIKSIEPFLQNKIGDDLKCASEALEQIEGMK